MSEDKRRRKRFQATASQQPQSDISRSSNRTPNPCKLFVTNISFKISMRELRDFFEKFGSISRCHIVTERGMGRSRGYGFLTFKCVDDVEKVLAATDDELTLDGRIMRVDRANPRKRLLAMQEVGGSREAGDGRDIGEGGECGGGSEDGKVEVEKMKLKDEPLTSINIPELNDDVLLLVLRQLGLKDRIRVERVSRRWYRAARVSWRDVHHISFHNCFRSFQGKYGGLSNDILHSVLKRCGKYLTSLDLSCTLKLLTDFGIDLIGMYCTQLERLDLSGVSVTQKSLRQLSQNCAKLKWLKVGGCHTVGEKCVWWALHNLKQLQYMDISNNRRIRGQCFFMAGSTLCHVYLQCCDKLVDSSMELLTARCPQLETLDISHCPRLTGTTILSITKVYNKKHG